MSNQEFEAILSVLARLVLDGRIAVLMLLLIGAAIYDYRTHRIPNRLVVCGAVFGVVYNTVFPPVFHGTVLFPLAGLAVGLVLFLPLYLIRAMGAGDVKLFAMVGAFLGPLATFYAALATLIVGGAASLIFVFARGTAPRLFQNLASLFQVTLLGALAGAPQAPRITVQNSAGKLPYGVPIAIGTIGYLVFHQLGLV